MVHFFYDLVCTETINIFNPDSRADELLLVPKLDSRAPRPRKAQIIKVDEHCAATCGPIPNGRVA